MLNVSSKRDIYKFCLFHRLELQLNYFVIYVNLSGLGLFNVHTIIKMLNQIIHKVLLLFSIFFAKL